MPPTPESNLRTARCEQGNMVRSDRLGLSSAQPAPSALTGLLASGSSSPIDSISNINEGSVRECTTNPTRETDSLITLRGRFSPPGPGGRETPQIIVIIITTTTTTTRISAPGRPQKPDFPPPALLVYETHNEGRLGKKLKKTDET